MKGTVRNDAIRYSSNRKHFVVNAEDHANITNVLILEREKGEREKTHTNKVGSDDITIPTRSYLNFMTFEIVSQI